MLLASQCVAFKSQQTGKYVRYMHEYQGFKKVLQMSGEHTKSPYTRFHPEPSTKHDGYYHIKSLYNNKYWVASQDKSGWYILVGANEPEEDLSKPSCTLFQIELNASNCEIFHAYTRGGVSILPSENITGGCLHVGDRNLNPFTFKLISIPSRFLLPDYVCFKGDNDQYLRVQWMRGIHFMQFSAGDKYDPGAFHSIDTNEDGTIRIRNHMVDKYWRLSPSWIWADYSSDAASNTRATLFLPEKFGDKVALKCLGNNKFCKRLTDYWENCLNANIDTITNEAVLRVEEPIRSRRIYGVEYHFEDAIVSAEEVILTTKVTDVNRTSVPRDHEMPIEYSITDQRKWESSTTWKIGGHLTISAGFPKVGVNAELQVEGGFEKSHTWGETHEETIKTTYHFKGTVPPYKKVKVLLKASKGTCDVPFSYWQEDLLANGQTVTNKFDDGVFRGVNSWDVNVEATEENP